MSRAARVLFVTPRFGDGGGERIWLNLLQNLDRSRFKPSLAFFEHVQSHFLDEIPSDIPVHDLAKRRRFVLDWLRLGIALAKVIRRESPDVVVSLLHTWGIVLHLARVISRRRFAIVINEHIHVSGSLRSLREKKPLASLPSRWAHRYCYRHADLIIPVAHDVARDLALNHGAKPDRIRVIYNGIDLDGIRRMASETVDHPWFDDGQPARPPIIIGIGRLSDQKGFTFLIRAFRDLVRRRPAKLVIIGEGDKRQDLEALIRSLDLDRDVALLGRQANPYKYLARASVFVLSSVGEALPTVLLEAMALGVPIVSTRCPCGPEELLENGKYGVLVPVADETALAEGILKVLEGSALRRGFAETGQARAETFRLRPMVEAYERCMEALACR
ncbi:MAG: glycosyltransferase [Candidatus Eisenbacteria bacterium]